MIIGTAGHVDHGKTALVKALTGVDCDRLKEEKVRGVTIDLGFAYLPTTDGQVLGFVDVPGHERYVRTMLAGATGIDFALLVVAADEGVKPQTLEHLAILDLLQVEQGLVVLNKADLTGPERLAEVAAQLRPALAGTALAATDALPVSAVTGQGLDALRGHLMAAAKATAQRSAETRFRLAVDRAFTLHGVGVVVTGTVLSGAVQVGDQLLISPSGLPARVRSLHAQNRQAEIGRRGERCALNLTGVGVSKEAVRRGDVVLDPALHAPTDRIDARLRVLGAEAKAIGQWLPVRLHHAAAEVGARIVLLGPPIEPGQEADVQLVLEQPIAAALQDRFVLRDVSAQRTIGGGRFIDLRGPPRRRRTPERRRQLAALALPDSAAAFSALLDAPPFAWDLAAFARDHALTATQGEQLVAQSGLIQLQAGPAAVALSPTRWRKFATDLIERLATFHRENPDLQGLGRENLRLQLQPRLAPRIFIAALQRLAGAGELVLDGAFVRLASHTVRLAPGDETAWALLAPRLGGAERFRPPRVRDLAHASGRMEGDVRRLLKLAGRLGWADEIAPDHFFLRATVREMVAIGLEEAGRADGGAFSASQFRDRLENGRKVAIQILEFFDRHGVTLRKADLRRLNPHRLDLFGPVMVSSSHAQGGASSPVGRSDFKSEWGSEPVPGGFDSHSLPPSPPRSGS
ncbi:MAG: selenocysteine-specific translation elongation factor [Phenylobacterium sp.]|nr:MAG: selenocysteine-specific translation elongation factor [Phenylobacterium sp.]